MALDKLNHSLVLDKPIRVMWSNRDPDARRSGVGNIFVKVIIAIFSPYISISPPCVLL